VKNVESPQNCAACNKVEQRFFKKYRSFLLSTGTLIPLANAVLLLAGFISGAFLKWEYAKWFYLASAVVGGAPIFRLAAVNVVKHFDLTAGVMVSIAMTAAIIVGEYSAAALVALMMLVGEMLEDFTVARADNALDELEELLPITANVKKNGEDSPVLLEEVQTGDIVVVRPGEHIPVDGVVEKGSASVNQAAITGESIPVDKEPGERVFAGTVCMSGFLEVTVSMTGKTTMVGRMIDLVKDARSTQAPVQRIANKYAQFFTPFALVVAAIAFLLTNDIMRSITVLVVLCPCSLVLATPTALTAAIGNSSRNGILVKSGPVMEQLGKVDIIAFDKTGTLTLGEARLKETVPLNGMEKGRILTLAAAAERSSEHPLAKAIVTAARENDLTIPESMDFETVPGHGVRASVDGVSVTVGERMLHHYNILVDEKTAAQSETYSDSGNMVIPVAVEEQVVGLLILSDTVRSESEQAVLDLKGLSIPEVILVSGDKKSVAESVGAQLGVDGVHAELLPEEKLDLIRDFRKQGKKVAFVGDGINDAPALALADVGIAMGGIGTHVAMETADTVLFTDRLYHLPYLIALSKKTLKTIRNNVIFSMSMNFLSVVLSIFGVIGPVVGAIMHEASALPVVANSARLIRTKPKYGEKR
jgi:Cd2+/Zn2+-exporting ATPase